MEPEEVTFHLLEQITDGFSEERKVGEGSFGVVYRGLTKNGEDVAVKRLRDNANYVNHDKQFQNELENLMKLKHQNIVRLFGYCYQMEQKPMEYNGTKILVEETHRALCLEYLHNGSLRRHLSDESSGLDWHTRYNIMKGTCESLKYMHEEPQGPLYHLDLKPDNILLDKNMVPKLADFGLSKIFGKELTRTTESPLGTLGYQPPEYIDRGEISKKFDIFSLGVVMIQIVSGCEGYEKCASMPSEKFNDLVKTNWHKRLQEKWSGSSLEAYCHQVEACTQIAMSCLETDTEKRPDIVKVVNKLNEIEIDSGKVKKNWRKRLQEKWTGSSLEAYCHRVKTSTQIALRYLETDTEKRPDIVKVVNKLNEIEIDSGKEHPQNLTMHNRMKMQMEPHDTTDQNQDLNLMASSSCIEVDIRETSWDVGEEFIIGRAEEKIKIMDYLLQSVMSNIIILPIYGIGGIGKTTFAKLIYKDTKFSCYSRVWVYVSSRLDLNKIGNSIISQLSREESRINETQMIHSRLMKLFSGKKILIILDDLWEDSLLQLNKLKDMVNPGDKSNIIVLVTTRSKHVADNISINIKAHSIEALTDGTCWDIIKQRSGFEARDDKEQLIDIGKKIAMKCGGVALAAQSLGFMLRPMKPDQWMEVKDSEIWNEANHVLASLKLSCTNMAPCLRSCFTYYAFFPKGYQIIKEELVYQWISLGFIEPTKLHSRMQLCEKYIAHLLGLSFLQHPVSPISYGQQGINVTLFMMHDLVHDLARSIMGDEVLDANRKHNIVGSNCRYVSLADCTKPLKSFVTYPDKIIALRFVESVKLGRDAGGLSAAKYLRVLDLGECSIERLPSSIGQLKLLRYLNAPGMKDRMVPNCITKLAKLIYLNLRGSSGILALPETIGEMGDLEYLDLSGCSEIRQLPKSFGKLNKLEHLDISNCSQITGVSNSLENLTQLKYLNLTGCVVSEELQQPLRMLRNLVHLDLSDCFEVSCITEALCSLTKLQYLNLSWKYYWPYGQYRKPLQGLLEVMGKLIELRYLNLSRCLGKSDDGGTVLDIISTLTNLEHLDLSSNMDLNTIPGSFCHLKKLHTLDLSECYDLRELPEELGGMDNLKFLILKDCWYLNMSTLENNDSLISLPKFVVHAAEGEQSSNLLLLKDVAPPELELRQLENVRSTEEARTIELGGKQSIVKLTLCWTIGKKGFVEDMELLRELVPPSSLQEFELRGYNSAEFPKWLMDITMYLPNIVSVTLWNLSQCSSLPPLGQLPNLTHLELLAMPGITKIDRDFCGGLKAFTQLAELYISCLENLEEWTTTYSDGEGVVDEFMFPNLYNLTLCKCHKLRLNPCPPRVKGTWKIIENDSVLLHWGESSLHTGSSTTSPQLPCLFIESSIVPIHQWTLLHHLPGVNKLIFQYCDNLNSSPDIAGVLCLLRELALFSCDMTSLPQWLGRLTSLQELRIGSCHSLNNLSECIGGLVSLKDLCIFGCGGMVSLPDSIQQLTNLESLSIWDCPALQEWCKLEENKMKISHIRDRKISTGQNRENERTAVCDTDSEQNNEDEFPPPTLQQAIAEIFMEKFRHGD